MGSFPPNSRTTGSNRPAAAAAMRFPVATLPVKTSLSIAELTNAADGKGKLDISDERQTAEQLLDDNRLFRQTARSTGATAVASVLDDLERVLLEISHSPSEVSNDQLNDLRQEIESRGLLFKVRVLGSQVREQESKPVSEKEKRKL